MNAVAVQMANLVTVLVQNQTAVHAGGTGLRRTAANTGPPDDTIGPTLKSGDVATFEPRSQSDADSASCFIDCIRDAVAPYGEPRTRTVLRCCCKGSIAEHWIAGVSDYDRALPRMNCSNWTAILERDFMPYLAFRLSAARAEAFHWNQGWTPAECVAKKLRFLRMANVVRDDEVVEELHRRFAAAPNLHLHLDKYVAEVGNSISEYRRAVVRLQDSARCKGYTLPQPHVGMCHSPFREPSGNLSSNTSQPHVPATRNAIGATTTGAATTSAVATSKASARVASQTNRQPHERLRKCRNYPGFGDSEHWDWQCVIKRTTGTEIKHAYYADPLHYEHDTDGDDDVNELLYNCLDLQPDLEEEYERAQNAYFAMHYREETGLGFLGTMSSQHKKSVECNNYGAVFPLNNKLCDHLRVFCRQVSEHTTGKATIVKSAAPVSSNLVEGLADFHYAKTFWYTTLGGTPHMACIDSGFGNSAVDDKLQRWLYPGAEQLLLPCPRVVGGLGGAVCTSTHVAILRIFMKGTDRRFAELVRPFHVFKDLSVPLLIGNDIMKPQKFDLLYSSNRLQIGACDGIPVQITVHAGHRFTRIRIHCAAVVIIPSCTSTIVGVKFGRALEPNQDYQFTRIQTHSAISGAGAPHSVLRHNQRELLYTNFADSPRTIFKGTVLGHVCSHDSSSSLAWEDALKDMKPLFGTASRPILAMTVVEILIPHQTDAVNPDDTAEFDPDDTAAEVSYNKTGPLPLPAQSKYPVPDNEQPYASKVFNSPQWLQEQYEPQYDHALPPYIKIPDATTSTWEQVIINTEDDISAAQVTALKSLIRHHQGIFNDIMGCVREPEEDWLPINVPPELEVKFKPSGMYHLTPRRRAALDEQFDLNREYGRMSKLDQPSLSGLKVFVVYQGMKAHPVVDMRKLNAAMIGDAYPLPRQEDVIQAMRGMRWLGSAVITSALYQRLIHPDHRYRTAISTHRGREVFNVSIMGGKTSVQHQQRLMDTKLIQRLSWRGASCYVDDIVMYAPSSAKFLGIVDEVFSILGNLGITLKAKKCFLGFHSLEILGYLVDRLGRTTAEAKADAVQNIPYPATLAQLEYFIGLTNWNQHLIPYYAQRIAPLQACKMLLLNNAPPSSRGRKDYAAHTAVPDDEKLIKSYNDAKDALASRPRLHHVVDDLPIYAFLDSSKEYGTGLEVYQLTRNPEVYSISRLVALHLMSKPLTDAETRYWPTHLEMSGIVWAAKRMRPYMERAFVTFVTNHHSNVALCKMQSINTTSEDRSSLRLNTWAIYLDQYRDHMHVVYSKGADLECLDALSRLCYDISLGAKHLHDWATQLGSAPEMEEFDIQ